MPLLKRTYTLPTDAVEEFERAVSPGKRSSIIAELLREWLEEQRREELRREIIEGCREMGELYLEVEREFQPLDREVDCVVDR